MDTLEAFERGRSLPKASLGHVSPQKRPVFPIKVDPALPCVWGGFNRSAIIFLDSDIALKLQTQYPVAQVNLPLGRMLLELSLSGFAAGDLAKDTFARLRDSPCPNLASEVDVGIDGVAFVERLTPLAEVWAAATKARRRRWAVELSSAFAHLEALGLVPVETNVQDLGVDETARLKLVGIGASPRRPSGSSLDGEEPVDGPGFDPALKYRLDMERAHQRLGSCLYYVLSGVDVDDQIRSMTSGDDLKAFREMVRRGDYPLDPESSAISDIIQAAWTKTTGSASFANTAEAVRSALEPLGIEQESQLPPVLAQGRHDELIAKARDWVNAQPLDPSWMGRAEYEAECESIGYPV